MHTIDSFFFFQAEDGIRDKLVTGVQTCALPISGHGVFLLRPVRGRYGRSMAAARVLRSEERRVGKGVDLGGRRIIKKKKKKKKKDTETEKYKKERKKKKKREEGKN